MGFIQLQKTFYNVILENEGIHTKLVISPLLLILHHLFFLSLDIALLHYDKTYKSFCIFMNFNENIKMTEKKTH